MITLAGSFQPHAFCYSKKKTSKNMDSAFLENICQSFNEVKINNPFVRRVSVSQYHDFFSCLLLATQSPALKSTSLPSSETREMEMGNQKISSIIFFFYYLNIT